MRNKTEIIIAIVVLLLAIVALFTMSMYNGDNLIVPHSGEELTEEKAIEISRQALLKAGIYNSNMHPCDEDAGLPSHLRGESPRYLVWNDATNRGRVYWSEDCSSQVGYTVYLLVDGTEIQCKVKRSK